MFSIIVAYDENRGIGKDNDLVWHIKDDLKLFKEHTLNKRIVMGHKTFESIGKPLPKRHTLIVSNNKKEDGENYSYIDDFSTFLKKNMDTSEEIMICGGANIYRQALPYCKKLCISKVNGVHDCDTFFPEFNESDYKLINTIKYADFTYYEYESVII